MKTWKANQLAEDCPPPKISLRAAVNVLRKSSLKIAKAPPSISRPYTAAFLAYINSLL